jgi:hypothetical protein
MQQEVIPMSVTTLFNSENNNNKRPVRSAWSGIQATAAVTVALLIAAFFVAVGCSKKSTNSSVNSENQNPSMQTYNSTPAAPVASQAAPAPVAPTPKKSARKRAVNVTYSDKTSGISFRYPRKYSLKSGDELGKDLAGLGPVGMSFVQPGGRPLVAVEMPEGSYPDTDFRSAYFDVSLNDKLTADECSQFSVANTTEGDSNKIQPTRVNISGSQFDVVEDFTGQIMKQSDAKYYHTYQNGVCYEFAMGLGTSGAGIDQDLTPVDRQSVFNKLEKILASVKISEAPDAAKAGVEIRAGEAKSAEEQKPVQETPKAAEMATAPPVPSTAAAQTAKADQAVKTDAAPKQ